MAAGVLQKPGTKYGPCDAKGSCQHEDCRSTVREAISICRICHKPIGYETEFYEERADRHPNGWPEMPLKDSAGNGYILVHSVCLWAEVEKARARTERGPSVFEVFERPSNRSYGIYDTIDEARGCVAFNCLKDFEIWQGDHVVEDSDPRAPCND